MAWVLAESRTKGTARCVLLSIANHVGPDGTGWVHVRRVLAEANCSLDSYRRAVREATDAGELVRHVRAGGSAWLHDAHRPNLFTFPALGGDTPPERSEAVRGDSRAVSGDVDAVFRTWVEVTGRDAARTKLTVQRRRKIEARLKEGYTVAELSAAVRGVVRSPFHMGDNDGKVRYDDLTVVLRDGGQVEKFAALDSPDFVAADVPGVRKPRGCVKCDNGFIVYDDGTVKVCDCDV